LERHPAGVSAHLTRKKEGFLTAEQLQAARAEKWRQKANPLLTMEDAEAWIESIGVSLFLPRKTQLQTPAPSLVEAVLGEANATPTPAAIQNAFELGSRLFAAEKSTPLNLLGSASEQPDFLVSSEALPYVFALRGDRDWKRGPRERSSALVLETWKLLKREGALSASELQELLGREVTEGAVIRALTELWTALRVLPVYITAEATRWELFESRHQKAIQIGSGMAQATALSALISLYLDSVIAAAPDEIEIFLSPLSPRSRIREVVRGLAATRQLLTIPLGAQSLLYIAGGLPEFPELQAPTEAEPQPETSPTPEERRPFVRRDKRDREQRFDRARKPFTPRESGDRPRRERPALDDRRGRDARRSSSRPDGPRREWKGRGEEREFRPRREWKREEKPPFEKHEWKPRREGTQEERGEFRPRPGGSGFKSYRNRTKDQRTGDQRPYKKFPPRDRDQERPPHQEWKPRREQSERKEFRPRRTEEASERREFKSRTPSGRGFKPRRESSEFSDRQKSSGEKRFGAKRSFEDGRTGFDRKKPPQRERRTEGGSTEGPRKSFSKPGFKGGKLFGRPKSGGKPSFGKKGSGRSGGKPSFGKRPNNRKGKKSGE
jgi:23S rRNA pseudouridine2605 synthase